MASASVSTALAYNSPAITTSCGTVFCSQTFEDFSINCTACSKDFNLLSCKLFIEHIKECLGSGIHKNTITEDVKTVASILDPLLCMKVEPEPPGCVEVTSFDHSEIKLECEDEEVGVGVEDEEVATRNVLDAIIVEYENHPVLWDEKLLKGATLKERTHHFNQITDVINTKFKADFTVSELRIKISNLRSGYMRAIKKSNRKLWYIDKMKYILGPSSVISSRVNVGEVAKPNVDSTEVPPSNMEVSDDNADESSNTAYECKTINKRTLTPYNLNHQHIISDIIDLYKQHTFLWDPSAPLYKDVNERKAKFCQMAEFINKKYHLAVTGQEILRKIESLRTSYRRATQNSISSNKPIALWYYEQLSFISEKKQEQLNLSCEEPEQIPTVNVSISKIDIPPDCESLNESLPDEVSIELHQSDDDFFDYELLNEDKEHSNTVISIITEFKKHPCLWKKKIYDTTDSSIRLESLESIKDAVNSTCNKRFSLPTIRQMFGYLTNSYRRVLRDKEAFEKDNQNEIFPIDLYYFDDISFIGSACSDVFALECDNSAAESGADDDEDENSGSDEEGPLLYRGLSTNNKKLITCVVKEYQKEPILWSIKQYTNNHFTRWDAYGRIAQAVNDTLNTNFTCKHMRGVIGRMRATHQRVSRLKQKNPNFKSDIWYIDLLSFIPSQDLDLEATGRSPKRSTVKSKDHLTAIIKHYKALPNLWDVNHSDYMNRNLRVTTLENLLAKINKEQACQLTIKELRYQIRFLKESYTRALCNETKEWITSKCPPKPFFFDQVSFLEPFIKPLTAPRIQLDARPDPNDDFTYLTDNQPLMISFINTYREQGCLWDQKHRDMDNISAQLESYDKIINMFSENEVTLSQDQVISAIAFLHATVVTTQRSSEHDDRVWFYEHLKFLGRIPGTCGKYCSHCGQHFSPSSEYEKHKIEIAGDFPYKCIACDIGFMTRSKYIYHKKTHRQPFKCEICDFRAYEKNNFKVHMLRHEGITPFPCTTCNRGFVTSTELKRHLLIHTGEKPFICYICGINMRSNAELYQHLKRHRNQRDYKCTECGRAFYTRKAMKTHMESHSDERNHVCDVCGATFKRKTTLRQHEAIHAEKKKHSCKICGNLFAQKAGLYSHMKVHNLNRE